MESLPKTASEQGIEPVFSYIQYFSLASKRPVTPSPPPIMTTSSGDALDLMGKCTATVDESRSRYKFAAILLVNLLATYVLASWMTTHTEGMVRVGWTASMVQVKGKSRRVMTPVYMAMPDYKTMTEER